MKALAFVLKLDAPSDCLLPAAPTIGCVRKGRDEETVLVHREVVRVGVVAWCGCEANERNESVCARCKYT